MDRGTGYIFGFAAAVCIICSLLLSVVSGSLRSRQEENRTLDRQKNVLMAAGYSSEDIQAKSREQVQKLYAESFEELVIDPAGNVLADVKQTDLTKKESTLEDAASKRLPLFRMKDPANPTQVKAYIYPIIGKGLWSTLYGYLAVKPDGDEVIGIAFYKHGETPGLGAEIEKEWFTNNFKGKRILQGGKIKGVEVVKGKVADKTGIDVAHAVDGMSGATLTGNGVSKLMRVIPRRYKPFFDKQGARTAMAGGER